MTNETQYQLPAAPAMMSAKSYKTKIVEPLILRLKSLISTVYAHYFKAIDNNKKLNAANDRLSRANERLSKINEKLLAENTRLRTENKDYSLLRRVFGQKQIDDWLAQAKMSKAKKREHFR